MKTDINHTPGSTGSSASADHIPDYTLGIAVGHGATVEVPRVGGVRKPGYMLDDARREAWEQ